MDIIPADALVVKADRPSVGIIPADALVVKADRPSVGIIQTLLQILF